MKTINEQTLSFLAKGLIMPLYEGFILGPGSHHFTNPKTVTISHVQQHS